MAGKWQRWKFDSERDARSFSNSVHDYVGPTRKERNYVADRLGEFVVTNIPDSTTIVLGPWIMQKA